MLGRFIPDFKPSPEKLQKQFDPRLEQCKPYLFHLANQLVDAYPDRKWNMLIGDDTSGRLPTRFVRKVFEGAGIQIPTRYIAASSSVNHAKPRETYDQYAKALAANAAEPVRGLIVSESGGTFGSLNFTHSVLAPHFDTLDTAVAVARISPGANLGQTYTGAEVGDETAMNAIWTAFEHPLQTRRGPQWSGPLTNLDRNQDPERADARRTDDKTYRSLAQYCFARMDTLATEYWMTRPDIDVSAIVPSQSLALGAEAFILQ